MCVCVSPERVLCGSVLIMRRVQGMASLSALSLSVYQMSSSRLLKMESWNHEGCTLIRQGSTAQRPTQRCRLRDTQWRLRCEIRASFPQRYECVHFIGEW